MKTIITLAIAALISATALQAEVITKGGASELAKAPVVKAGVNAVMTKSCANCKSEFAKVATPNFKGSAPTTSTVEKHACASCGTKWVTTGHGKAKVETAAHTCGGCKS